ncbi:MAG: DUF3850 domain-containing protein [Pseudobdellovibrionaceae bacterium]
MADTHYLKTWPQYFEHVRKRTKKFEYRKNDRDFKFGDTVVLQEWNPERPYLDKVPGPLGPPMGYTGETEIFKIGYIFHIPDSDYVIFSLLEHSINSSNLASKGEA